MQSVYILYLNLSTVDKPSEFIHVVNFVTSNINLSLVNLSTLNHKAPLCNFTLKLESDTKEFFADKFNFNEDYFIPIVNSENYTINVSIFYSSSETVCDYFMNGPTETVTFLSNNNFENSKSKLELFPNPSMGKVELRNSQTIKRAEIFDNVGRLVKIIKEIHNNQIDLSEFNDGLYLLKVEFI